MGKPCVLRARCLRGLLGSGRAVILLGALLVASIAATATLTTWHAHTAAFGEHLQEMNAMGVVVTEQTSRYLQVTDLVMQDAQTRIAHLDVTTPAAFQHQLVTKDFQDYLAGRVRNVAGVDAVSLVDAKGHLVNTSRYWLDKPLDVSDRDFFLHFKNRDDPNAFIGSTVVSRASGGLSVIMARRINAPDGQFLGLILGIVNVSRLADFYRTAGDQLHESVVLLRTDGTILLSYPNPEATAGLKLPASSPWYRHVASGGGAFTKSAAIDDVRSLIVIHLLHEFPLVVDIVMHESDVFERWHRETTIRFTAAVIASLVIAALCGALARQFRRQVEQNAQLEQAAISINESRQTVQAYAEISADWFWEQDADFRFVRNTLLPSIPGMGGVGKTRWELPGVTMPEAQWAAHKADLAARRPYRNFHMQRTSADGTILHWIANGDPVFDSNGIFTGYRGTGRDITAEVEASKRLAQANADLQLGRLQIAAVLDNIHQGVCFFDTDRRLQLWNRRYTEIYRLPPDALQPGCSLHEVLRLRAAISTDPELTGYDREGWVDHLFSKQEPEHHTVSLHDGRTISVYQRPMPGGGWVVTHEDVTEREKAEASIAYMARHDALTRLPNRGLFQDRMEQAIAMAGRGSGFAVMGLDLDNFKQVNDTLGHPVGDALLVAVADRLAACAREGDTVARLGGDEFAIIQLGVEQPEDAEVLTSRIITAFRQPFILDGREVMTGISIGVTVASGTSMSHETLMKNTDLALYLAKTDGRGTVRFFEPGMDAHIRERRMLEMDLQGALARNEFELFYQPQIDLAQDKLVGFEALLRWRHPTRGLISPLDFIPVAEETGMIAPIGEWVLRTACFEAENWPGGIMVAVNLSPIQFRKGDLLATVQAALTASGLPPNRLELEITESVMLGDTAGTLNALHALRSQGICIALDDFGTGYSSLSYLHSFPFDKIKIDQSFVRDLLKNKEAMSIIRAVTGLGHSLNIRTTAEGVETPEQLARLREEGCCEVQGYLFSRPVPASALPALIERLQTMGQPAETASV